MFLLQTNFSDLLDLLGSKGLEPFLLSTVREAINRGLREVMCNELERRIYALPVTDDGLVEIEAGFDGDGSLEWIDDGDEAKEGVDITLKGTGPFSSYQRVGKFSPTSKPGIFLGYHFENGGKWNGDYIGVDEDFKRNARYSVHQVKKIYTAPKEQWTFPMLAVYDKQTRSVCISDPAMQTSVPKESERLDASDMLDLEDVDEIFALDEQHRMTDDEIRAAREAELRAESSHGGGVD